MKSHDIKQNNHYIFLSLWRCRAFVMIFRSTDQMFPSSLYFSLGKLYFGVPGGETISLRGTPILWTFCSTQKCTNLDASAFIIQPSSVVIHSKPSKSLESRSLSPVLALSDRPVDGIWQCRSISSKQQALSRITVVFSLLAERIVMFFVFLRGLWRMPCACAVLKGLVWRTF